MALTGSGALPFVRPLPVIWIMSPVRLEDGAGRFVSRPAFCMDGLRVGSENSRVTTSVNRGQEGIVKPIWLPTHQRELKCCSNPLPSNKQIVKEIVRLPVLRTSVATLGG